jgi:hypothetical protein
MVPFGAFLARGSQATVLIDTGLGPPPGEEDFMPVRQGVAPTVARGHMSVLIESGGQQAIVLADVRGSPGANLEPRDRVRLRRRSA